jgi:hypothetical protein
MSSEIVYQRNPECEALWQRQRNSFIDSGMKMK